MAAGDLHAAVGVEVEDREVQDRRGHDADVDEVDAGREQAFAQRRVQARRVHAAVAAERDALRAGAPEMGADRAAELAREAVVEVAVGHAADVVFAKDARVHVRAPVTDKGLAWRFQAL